MVKAVYNTYTCPYGNIDLIVLAKINFETEINTINTIMVPPALALGRAYAFSEVRLQ